MTNALQIFVNYLRTKRPHFDGDVAVEVRSSEDGDAVKDASEMWTDTMKEMSEDEENRLRTGGESIGTKHEDLLKDVYFILNRMANKSDKTNLKLLQQFSRMLDEHKM